MKKRKGVNLLVFLPGLIFSILVFPFRLLRSIFLICCGALPEKRVFEKKQLTEYSQFEVLETIRGDYNAWEKTIAESDSKIGIILGARGSGKTGIGLRMLENFYAKTKRKCFAMGFKEEDLPPWIKAARELSNISEDAFVLIDEGGVLFGSRDAMTKANKLLSELILISRHKSLSIIFISQNSANLDVNILRQADYLVLKPSSLLQMDFERKKIKDIYTERAAGFEKYKHVKGMAYIYSDSFCGFVSNELPSFWSAKISKSFKQQNSAQIR